MGKALVIAEKSSLAQSYVKALGNFKYEKGYYESDKYVIVAAAGHLISLAKLAEYDSRFKNNFENKQYIIDTLPYFPKKYMLRIREEDKSADTKDKGYMTAQQRVKIIEGLMKRKDVDVIVNGCDAGREGELIFYYIYDYLNCTLPVKRLWVSTQVEDDLRKAFANLKDGSEFEGLKQAAYARSEGDWEHGINLSALYTTLYGGGEILSLGRVQTPVLDFIVKREREIQNFKPEDYFLIDGHFKTMDNFDYKGRLITKDKIKSMDAVSAILKSVENRTGIIESIEKKLEKKPPELLYNLTDLQKDMDLKYFISAARTDTAIQALYEKYKAVSYPRTESNCITKTMVDEFKEKLDKLPPEYAKEAKRAKTSGCFYSKVVNDAKVTDHHGIMPTGQNINTALLTDDEKKVFDAIVRRYLGIFYPNYEYESTVIITKVEEHRFKTTGQMIVELGWKELYKNIKNDEEDNKKDDVENQLLAHAFYKGEQVLVSKVDTIAKKTQPPARYRDATLLEAMEYAGRFVKDADEAIKDAIKEKGIGTQATRKGIISLLLNRQYIVKEGKYYHPTDRGIQLIDTIKVEEIKSPELTGEWEYKLKLVEKNQYAREKFSQELHEFIKMCCNSTRENFDSKIVFKGSSGAELGANCPICGKKMSSIPKGYICEGFKECRFFIPTKILEKKISEKEVVNLCKNKKTGLIKGFTSKNNTKFDAYLVFSEEEKKIKFEMPPSNNHKFADIKCPLCGSEIVCHDWGYGCSNYKGGCKFSISKKIAGKILSEKNIRDLIEKNETEEMDGFVSSSNRKFKARLKLENGSVKFITNGPQKEGNQLELHCPNCKAKLDGTAYAYKCPNAENGCKFSIQKEICGITLTEEQMKSLTQSGKTDYIEGFKSNSGKIFAARLMVIDGAVKFDFKTGNAKDTMLKCPMCKGAVKDASNSYICSNKDKGCTFFISKKLAGRELSEKEVQSLLDRGETEFLDGFISKAGKNFRAKLKMENGKVIFAFT